MLSKRSNRSHYRIDAANTNRRVQSTPGISSRELWMVDELRHGIDPGIRDAGTIQSLDYFGRGQVAKHVENCGIHRCPMLDAIFVRLKPRVVRQFGSFEHHRAEGGPLPI